MVSKVFKGSEGQDGINLLAGLPEGASGTILFSRATNISQTRQHVTVDEGHGRLTFVPYGNEVILEKGATKRKKSGPLILTAEQEKWLANSRSQ